MNSYYVIMENGLLVLMRAVNNSIKRPGAQLNVRLVQVIPPYAGIQEHTAIMEVADDSPPPQTVVED